MTKPTDQEIIDLFTSGTSGNEIIEWCRERDLNIKATYLRAHRLGALHQRQLNSKPIAIQDPECWYPKVVD